MVLDKPTRTLPPGSSFASRTLQAETTEIDRDRQGRSMSISIQVWVSWDGTALPRMKHDELFMLIADPQEVIFWPFLNGLLVSPWDIWLMIPNIDQHSQTYQSRWVKWWVIYIYTHMIQCVYIYIYMYIYIYIHICLETLWYWNHHQLILFCRNAPWDFSPPPSSPWPTWQRPSMCPKTNGGENPWGIWWEYTGYIGGTLDV